MKSVFTSKDPSDLRRRARVSSGPLSDLECSGGPCSRKRFARVSSTSIACIRRLSSSTTTNSIRVRRLGFELVPPQEDGHANINQTMIYAHLSQGMKKDAVDRLDDLFGYPLATKIGSAG